MAKLLSEETANKIKQMIISGKFPFGSKLPSENELIEQLQVSRSTVREAIKLLKSSGVVTIKRGVGTYVKKMPGVTEDPLGLLFCPKDQRVMDLMEMRLLLEPGVAGLACERATKEDICVLFKCAKATQEMYSALSWDCSEQALRNAQDSDIAFHSAIFSATHNSALSRLFPLIQESLSRSFSTPEYARAHIDRHTSEGHFRIAELILEQDKEGVMEQSRKHILLSIQLLKASHEREESKNGSNA